MSNFSPDFPLLRVSALSAEKKESLWGDSHISLRRISFDVDRGKIVAFCGESGSGKSTLTSAILGCLDPQTRIIQGHLHLDGESILKKGRRGRRKLRRTRMSFVDRNVRNQLNPNITVRQHLKETLLLANRQEELGDEKDWAPLFYEVGIVEPELVVSKACGDLKPLLIQRLMLLTAIFSGADLLICDEPTAELDNVSEKNFLEVLCQLRDERKMGILLTCGFLKGVERFADSIYILCEGGILESGPARQLVREPHYPYTSEFYQSSPDITNPKNQLPVVSKDSAQIAEKIVHKNFSSLAAARVPDPDPKEEEKDSTDESMKPETESTEVSADSTENAE